VNTKHYTHEFFMNLLGYYKPLPVRCAMFVVVTFLIALVVGYKFAPELSAEDSLIKLDLLNFRDKPFEQVHVPLSDQHQQFFKLAMHNTMTIALVLYLGTVVFFFPLFKDAVLGCLGGVALWNLGSPWLWGRFLFPHALVELPVIFYASAVSMSSGLKWLAGRPEGRWGILKRELVANLKLFLLLIPLIIFAALLEAYVTNRW